MGLASALLAGCQQTRVASTQYGAAYPPPTHTRLRIKTEPVPESYTVAPAASVPAAVSTAIPATTAPTATDEARDAAPGVSRGFITETPPAAAPHGTTPTSSRPGEAVGRPAPAKTTPAPTKVPPANAAPRSLPASTAPRSLPPATPAGPTLPPPPTPSSRIVPGASKGAVDPNTPETIIITSQTDTGADRALMLVKNKTAPVPAQAVTAAPATPKEGVCTITGEAQQFRRTWRLRYAPLDSDDTNGGSVMLVGEGLSRIREGQQIRVVGVMHPAEERGDSPRFEVQFLEVLSR